MNKKIAIVTTLRNADLTLNSFIQYHLSIGFDRIYLFFDDERDPSVAIAEKYHEIMIIKNNATLQNVWRKAPTYTFNKNFIRSEAMSRQILNVEVAVRLALKENIDWLLHIDIDELFYITHGTVKDHFEKMDIQGYDSVSYVNYEGIPEIIAVNDYFKEVTLFKKNPKVLSKEQKDYYKNLPLFNNGKDYFWFYGNGKSAAKVNMETSPDGVHAFKSKKIFFSSDPKILHYPICGFKHFWNKYITLGQFKNKWFNKLGIPSRMHLKARDVVCSGDKTIAKNFYTSEIESLKNLNNDLVTCGIVERIVFPSNLIKNLSSK